MSRDVETSSNHRHELFRNTWAVVAAFGTYFCMYAFRKPFTAAQYADTTLWGLGFKTVLVTSQVAGYMVSKFIGIKVIAEIPPRRRAVGILVLVLAAEASLILFGLIPRPWNALCLFLNGLPLGMVFGLVLGCLEGRRMTEALTAGLCSSFILADGFTKSAGAWLLKQGVPEDWMPGAAGGLFLIPLGIGVAMLTRIPPPNDADIEHRAERFTMTRSERRMLFARYAAGLIPITIMYLLVTILRSVRADFAPELWKGLGVATQPAIFSTSELWVALGVLALNGAAVVIQDNRRAFFTALATAGLGFVLLAVAAGARAGDGIGGFPFMVLVGLGLYLPYVAIHTTIFERLLAMTRDRGNIGFLMYVVDAFGYLGYVLVITARTFVSADEGLIQFFDRLCLFAAVISAVCLAAAWTFFARITRRAPATVGSNA